MDQNQGSQAQQPEKGTREPDGRMQPYRQVVESSLRLHGVLDPERVVQLVPEVLRATLGVCSGFLTVRRGDRDQHVILGVAAPDLPMRSSVRATVEKALEAGAPVVDGYGADRYVCVPLGTSGRRLGALYIGVAELEARVGSAYLDILGLLGRHIGLAVENAGQVTELAANAAEAGDAMPDGLSLRDSKKVFERRLIQYRLNSARGNIAAAARSLEMDRGQLSRLLKKHGVDKTDFKATGGR